MYLQDRTNQHQGQTGVEVQGYIFLPRGQDWEYVQAYLGQAINKLQLSIPNDSRARPQIYADFTDGHLKVWVREAGTALREEIKSKIHKAPECVRAEIWMRNDYPTMHECRVWHAGTLSVKERLKEHGL
jgi:hypothetical protein